MVDVAKSEEWKASVRTKVDGNPLHYFRKTFSENELRASANDLTVTYTLAPDAVLQGSPAIQ